MSFALKRKFPKTYIFFKKFEKHVPAWTHLWDEKKYLVNLKIISMIRYWRHYPRLKAEADIVYGKYKGGDFIDVGAYEGIYSFLLAPKANHNDTFISCEPNLDERHGLTENLNILKRLFKKITFISHFKPVGDGKNVIKMPTTYGHPVFLNEMIDTTKLDIQIKSIKSTSLDELVRDSNINPKFIKIDVEGAEFGVLLGMSHVLEHYKPMIMIEKHPTLIPKNIEISQIDNFLIKKGYKLETEIFKDDIAITEIGKNNNQSAN